MSVYSFHHKQHFFLLLLLLFFIPSPNEGISGRSGGRPGSWSVAILRRELLPQFSTDIHKTWHRCVSWVVDVQDAFFGSTRKYVAMVMAYYGQKLVPILRRELLPQFLINFYEIWYRCASGDVNVQDTYFGSDKKCVAMVTACYWQNIGQNASWQNCFISVQLILMEFTLNVCLRM